MTTVRFIGGGSYGVVEEISTPTGNVAIKKLLLTSDPEENEDRKRRFKREVEYQARLSHFNIVSIFQYDLDCDHPWFTMPLAVCHLGDEEKYNITMTDEVKIETFRMIMDGVEYIHAMGQIHRDLKPQNILRYHSPDNQYFSYAISDFGLVADRSREETTALTMTDVIMGTFAYMPCECYGNAKSATQRSDIYSLGVILKFIFDGSTGMPLRERQSESIFGDVISKCTKDHPDERYQTVADLREAFELAIAKHGVS